MKIAVTGPNGQLGSELVKQGAIPLHGRLMSAEMTTNIEHIKPDAIINCAALTDVDYCEQHIHQSAMVNAGGVQYLSDIFGGYLVQISTDYVFNGLHGPYGVRDAPSPINVYGWSKLGGELVMHRHRGPSLIIRTTILFSAAKNNFVAKIAKQLRDVGKVDLYNPGVSGTPTYVPDLATEIIRMAYAKYEGMAHIVGGPPVSRYNFACQIAEMMGCDSGTIEPIFSLPHGAPRPKRSGLICDHDGYDPIRNHNYLDGLERIIKTKRDLP